MGAAVPRRKGDSRVNYGLLASAFLVVATSSNAIAIAKAEEMSAEIIAVQIRDQGYAL